jgi:hypothetical protein
LYYEGTVVWGPQTSADAEGTYTLLEGYGESDGRLGYKGAYRQGTNSYSYVPPVQVNKRFDFVTLFLGDIARTTSDKMRVTLEGKSSTPSLTSYWRSAFPPIARPSRCIWAMPIEN